MRRALVIVLALGCGSKPTPVTPTDEPRIADAAVETPTDKPTDGATAGSDGGSMNKTPGTGSKGTFVRGAALTPKDKLVTWLESQKLDGKPRLLRLPLVLPKGKIGFDIAKARVGSGADALVVYANDSSLGIGLADRARSKCKDAETCAFWVEGYWRGEAMGSFEIEVKNAEVLPADQLATATHAEVEGESGN